MISRFGGIYRHKNRNLLNPGAPKYILEAIKLPIFGINLYPTVVDKAAAIGWTIINKHVFNDGTKRTGIEACRLFLEINGHNLKLDSSAIGLAKGIAEKRISFDQFRKWILENLGHN